MVDEAQDTNPVFGKVYRNQSIQKIYVGDSYQAIYRFRGAGDELKKVEFGYKLPLTESYRFGPSLAKKANNALKKMEAEKEIVGLGADLIVLPIHKCLTGRCSLIAQKHTLAQTLFAEQ